MSGIEHPLSMRTRLTVARERWSNGGIDLFPVPDSWKRMFGRQEPGDEVSRMVGPGQFAIRCDTEFESYEEPPAGSKEKKPVLVWNATVRKGILVDMPRGRWFCAERTENEVIRGLKFPPKQIETSKGLALQVVN